jgi:hypothetical protein
MQRLKTLNLKYWVLCKWTAVLIAKEKNRRVSLEVGESILALGALEMWYHPILDAILNRCCDIATCIPRGIRESITRIQIVSFRGDELTTSMLFEYELLISNRLLRPTCSEISNPHSNLPPRDNHQTQPSTQGVFSSCQSHDFLDQLVDSMPEG